MEKCPKKNRSQWDITNQKKGGKNDKIIKKSRQKRMVTSTSMPNTNNRSSVARIKNARLYVRNNSTCTNRRKRNV